MSSSIAREETPPPQTGGATSSDLEARLALQRAAVEREPYPDVATRKDRLQRAIDMLLQYQDRMIDAAQEDFGQRPEVTCLQSDLMFPVFSMRHALKHVDRWVRPEKRRANFPLGLLGARTYVYYQPLGVVGIISPWNVPFGLAFAPLAGVFAAGNRAMLKPSEHTPHCASLIDEMARASFDPDELAVALGGVEVAGRFSALPFDHLIFTGGAAVARPVMHAAAENLTPVTLELGGKAPVILARGADLEAAATKVVAIKLGNGGQACMGVDHILVHHSDRDAFIEVLKRRVSSCFPDYPQGPDLTHVFLEKQRRRLGALVADAAQRGAKVDIIGGGQIESLASRPDFPLALVLDPPADAAVMREEIFGPVLPIVGYDTLEEAARQVRSRERPLALYFFGGSREEQDYILRNTWAGGVSFDDVMLHVLMEDLPFGGVGESGMGRYGGHAGFTTFSNAKAVAHRPRFDITQMTPPFTPRMSRTLRWLLKNG